MHGRKSNDEIHLVDDDPARRFTFIGGAIHLPGLGSWIHGVGTTKAAISSAREQTSNAEKIARV